MNKQVLTAWIVTAICVLAGLVAAVAQPLHWKRTVAAAVVVGVIAASVALLKSRRTAQA